jgi:hypothetical protein
MTASVPVPQLIEGLRDPNAYRHQVAEVLFRQTHISLLFFADNRVYKVKKPVDLGFLDFSTLERRHFFCEEEVRLNRRLAPHVYLGVVPIVTAPGGGLRVGGDGEPVEWAVEMVRLPEHRMLGELLERGEIDNEQMNDAAALLADFHGACPSGPGVDEHAAPEALAANEEENFTQLRDFVPGALSIPQFELLRTRRLGWIEAHRGLLEARAREGHVREGHGDLHAGNICFTDDGIVAYDCIEFSRRFRCNDVAADLAFLTMDLDYCTYPAFSRYLAHRYASVAEDQGLAQIEPFYKGYRAIVRSKIAALTSRDASLGEQRRAALLREAMRYAQLAVGYELPPALFLMCGLPACGKSWLAKRLSGALRAVVLQSDTRRKVLARMHPTERVHEDYETGLYSPAMKERTYASLLENAFETLATGRSVIVDATFSKRDYRAPFLERAAGAGHPCYVVHVETPEAVALERLEQRALDPSATSDADAEVFRRTHKSFERPDEAPQVAHVSGDGVPEEQVSRVLDRMLAAQPG